MLGAELVGREREEGGEGSKVTEMEEGGEGSKVTETGASGADTTVVEGAGEVSVDQSDVRGMTCSDQSEEIAKEVTEVEAKGEQ